MFKYLNKITYPQDLRKLDIDCIEKLCKEIRLFMIDSVQETGGHLGSSLGGVEIAVALHYVFNTPDDKIVWDIGHQSYAHKILTGRKSNFGTLRQYKGISGFSAPYESEYDTFIGGHSSTAVSTAVGLKQGLKALNKNDEVIAVIGDSAITAGMSLEGLNHLGSLKSKVIVILNDNDMSISKTQGAFSEYFSKIRLSDPMVYLKNFVKNTFEDKFAKHINVLAKKIGTFANVSKESNIFESLGFKYIGPVDGHDINLLIEILQSIKGLPDDEPILLHIVTQKGKGYLDAEQAVDNLHGVAGNYKPDVEEGKVSNTEIFSQAIVKESSVDDKIVAITAAMSVGTGLESFKNTFPHRFYDVGIAEQHATSFAAGLAKAGMKPFVCIYSTFMQRAYDQVVHDVSISSLPVRFVLDRAGFVGVDGVTHAGVLDYSMFLPLPNIVFMAPSCKEDIPLMINLMVNINDKPSFIRFAKFKHKDCAINYSKIELGKGIVLQEGKDIAILSIGEILMDVLKASAMLNKDGINITIADAKFAKPIDEELIIKLVNNHKYLIVVEEGMSAIFYSMVMQVIAKHNLLSNIIVKNICLPDCYIEQGGITEQKKMGNIDKDFIYKFCYKLIKSD